MDNQTATLAIALQLHDLDQLEQSGDLEKAVIDIQRQQLEIDSGFDNVAFEASRRLALSMAKAIEDDSAILAETTRLPQLDDATFHRLAPVNQLPRPAIHSTDHPSNSSQANPSQQNEAFEYQQQRRQQDVIVIHDSVGNACKRKHEDNEEVTTSKKARSVPPGTLLLQHTHVAAEKGERSTAPVSSDLLAKELLPTNLASSLANDDTSSAKADCASCCDSQDINRLVKASCDHHYCRDCFEKFVEASLQTTDGFPPSCCKIPIAFNVVANNVSIPLFHRYRSRQEEIQNATALYCSILGCGVRIESDNISVTTYRAACKACYRDTCTKCRGEVPIKHEDRHICKKDPGREAVLALAKQEGWQACYKCGTMVSLNFGCHHMTYVPISTFYSPLTDRTTVAAARQSSVTSAANFGRHAVVGITTNLASPTEPPEPWAYVQPVASLKVYYQTHALVSSSWQTFDRGCKLTAITIPSAGGIIQENVQADATFVSMKDGSTYFHARIALSHLADTATTITDGKVVNHLGMTSTSSIFCTRSESSLRSLTGHPMRSRARQQAITRHCRAYDMDIAASTNERKCGNLRGLNCAIARLPWHDRFSNMP